MLNFIVLVIRGNLHMNFIQSSKRSAWFNSSAKLHSPLNFHEWFRNNNFSQFIFIMLLIECNNKKKTTLKCFYFFTTSLLLFSHKRFSHSHFESHFSSQLFTSTRKSLFIPKTIFFCCFHYTKRKKHFIAFIFHEIYSNLCSFNVQ